MTDSTALREDVQAFNRDLETLLATVEPPNVAGPVETRRARREGRGIFPPPVFLPQARDLDIPGRDGPIRLRVLAPTSGASAGAYLHLHGGGWVLGAADMQDVGLQALADSTGLTTVSVDYRLAPEHPFPAGPDDCEDAALWLLEHGLEELDVPRRVAMGGESAGAHLAVLALLRLRDAHDRAHAIAGVNLMFGVYDLTLTPSQRLWGERYLVLSTPLIRWYADCFLPRMESERRREPDVSPLYADLTGMPPAVFTVGTLDPLLDDSLFLEARWRAAGNRADLHVVPDAVHGFTAYPLAVAAEADARVADFLRALP